jgi:hypothetical protein
MGVSFFRESAPTDFATFDVSFYAMCVRVGLAGKRPAD